MVKPVLAVEHERDGDLLADRQHAEPGLVPVGCSEHMGAKHLPPILADFLDAETRVARDDHQHRLPVFHKVAQPRLTPIPLLKFRHRLLQRNLLNSAGALARPRAG
jgi:hypothetical protein